MEKLLAISFLAPNMMPVYQFITDYLGRELACKIQLVSSVDYEDVYNTDLSFICGLPYVLRTSPRRHPSPIEAIAAPVLRGERYQNGPIYFSDVIVHRDSPFQSFADLRGRSWAYNEPESQSGYGITCCWLVKMGETNGYFGKVIEAGFHQKAIRMVCDREVDATAIDSQVLAVELRDHPQLGEQLRIIDSLVPSTIQPLTAASHLPQRLKCEIQTALLDLHNNPAAKPYLEHGFIDHFTAVEDADYDDIRHMLALCEGANFLTLR